MPHLPHPIRRVAKIKIYFPIPSPTPQPHFRPTQVTIPHKFPITAFLSTPKYQVSSSRRWVYSPYLLSFLVFRSNHLSGEQNKSGSLGRMSRVSRLL